MSPSITVHKTYAAYNNRIFFNFYVMQLKV